MSFQKYLETISNIDPGKIYVENIRSFMKVSSHRARTFCEMAVRDKLFTRKIGLICPNDGRIIEEYDEDTQFPETITCHICQAEDREPHIFRTAELRTIVFYKLNK